MYLDGSSVFQVSSIAVLFEQFWLIGVVVLAVVAIIAIAGGIVRSREKAKYRGPQYRRHS